MTVDYCRDLEKNFLIINSEQLLSKEKTDVEEQVIFSVKMLLNNEIDGLLPFELRVIDNRNYYYYDITGLSSVSQLNQQKMLGYKRVSMLLEQLIETVKGCREYLLDSDDFLLGEHYIFWSEKEQRVYLLFVPGLCQDFRKQMSEVAEYFMNCIDYKEEALVLLVYGFHKVCTEEDCTFSDMEGLLKERIHEGLGAEYGIGVEDSDIRKDNVGSNDTANDYVANNYVANGYTSNNYASSNYTSNDYTSNNYASSNYTSNDYTSNNYASSNYTSNDYTSNNYASSNYISNENAVGGMEENYTENRNVKENYMENNFVEEKNIKYMNEHKGREERQDTKNKRHKLSQGNKVLLCACLFAMSLVAGVFMYEKGIFYSFITEQWNIKVLIIFGILVAGLLFLLIFQIVKLKTPEEEFELDHTICVMPPVEAAVHHEKIFGYLVPEDGETEKEIKITEFPCFIGKSRLNNAGVCENRAISRYHARIDKVADNYFVTDLNSTNGTYVNQEKIPTEKKWKIKDKDQISFANVSYSIHFCKS